MVAQYTVPVFDQVRVLTEEGDLGMLYPEMIESTHPFQITDNPLLFALSTSSKEEQQTALKAIYDQVSQITYAPLELNCQGDPSFEPGDIITVRNRYGEEIGLPIMEQRISYTGGLSMVIKSLGSSSEKGVVQGPLTESVIALRKRANVLQRELDFTRSEIKEVSYAADAIVTEVNEITQRVDGLVLSSSRTGGANLLKGSSARLGLEEWQVDGAVICDLSTEVYNDTAAGLSLIHIYDRILIEQSIAKQYGVLPSQQEELSYSDWYKMVGGLMEDTPLGQVVGVRSEKDKERLKHFSPAQRRIRAEWTHFIGRKKNCPEQKAAQQQQLASLQMALAEMFKPQ